MYSFNSVYMSVLNSGTLCLHAHRLVRNVPRSITIWRLRTYELARLLGKRFNILGVKKVNGAVYRIFSTHYLISKRLNTRKGSMKQSMRTSWDCVSCQSHSRFRDASSDGSSDLTIGLDDIRKPGITAKYGPDTTPPRLVIRNSEIGAGQKFLSNSKRKHGSLAINGKQQVLTVSCY
jgi:hypothetical protein